MAKKKSPVDVAARQSKISRTKARKDARRRAQAEAEQRNKMLRAQGKPTPWEQAKEAAKERKAPGKKEA